MPSYLTSSSANDDALDCELLDVFNAKPLVKGSNAEMLHLPHRHLDNDKPLYMLNDKLESRRQGTGQEAQERNGALVGSGAGF